MIWTLSMRITIYVICFIFGIIIGVHTELQLKSLKKILIA